MKYPTVRKQNNYLIQKVWIEGNYAVFRITNNGNIHCYMAAKDDDTEPEHYCEFPIFEMAYTHLVDQSWKIPDDLIQLRREVNAIYEKL